MKFNDIAFGVSVAVLFAAPAAALDKGADWDALARQTQGKASAILAGDTRSAAVPGKPIAARDAAADSSDWCGRERAKNAETAAEVETLHGAGKISAEQRDLLKRMTENALRSVNLTCSALAGGGESISKAESNRRWCLKGRAENAQTVAQVEGLFAAGAITAETREILLRMSGNALRSVELTCSAVGAGS